MGMRWLNMSGEMEKYDHQPFFYSDLFDLGYEAVESWIKIEISLKIGLSLSKRAPFIIWMMGKYAGDLLEPVGEGR